MSIQVSDIHLTNQGSIAPERVTHISKAVANVEVELQAVVVALGGDVAYSGAQEEYEVAKTRVAALKAQLESTFQNVPVFVLGVPGNHDCNFKEEKSARPILIDSIAKDPTRSVGPDVLAQCTVIQANFFKFLNTVQTPNRFGNAEDAYFEFEMSVGEGAVSFRCYNTTMGSVLHEKPGRLAIPHVLLNSPTRQRTPDYVVAIFHHPYNWLSQFNTCTVRKPIDATSDLILTGHEHDADNYAKYTRRGESMTYLEGLATSFISSRPTTRQSNRFASFSAFRSNKVAFLILPLKIRNALATDDRNQTGR